MSSDIHTRMLDSMGFSEVSLQCAPHLSVYPSFIWYFVASLPCFMAVMLRSRTVAHHVLLFSPTQQGCSKSCLGPNRGFAVHGTKPCSLRLRFRFEPKGPK